MTDEITENTPAHEVLTDQDNAATPLRHQPEQVQPEPEAPVQAKSASEAIKAAMEKMDADDKDPQPDKAKEPKEEPKPKDVEPAKEADKADVKEAAASDAQSEGKSDRIPSRLLPKEREVWANVPNAVKAAWERMETEHTSAAEKYEASAKFHEELREYDDMAKSAKTNIKTALDRYVGMDKALAANFGQGMAQIAQAFNKNPVEAVAQFMRAAGVMPQQLGAYLQGNPAQPAQPQMHPQARQLDPMAQQAMQKVTQLEEVVSKFQQSKAEDDVHNSIVAPFMERNPDFKDRQVQNTVADEIMKPIYQNIEPADRLELGYLAVTDYEFANIKDDVAKLLSSGIIDTSLSPVDRVAKAKGMVDALNGVAPASQTQVLAEPVGKSASGASAKSISGSPGKSPIKSGKPKVMSIRDSIAAAMRTA